MARRLYVFDAPDRFLAAALGEPGTRTFYLQAQQGMSMVSVSLEKSQVAALAVRMAELLGVVDAPEVRPTAASARLREPIRESFRVGPMAVAWDSETRSVVVEAQPISDHGEFRETADDDPGGPDAMRVRLDPAQARSFVRSAVTAVAAGRPPCPFCGQPLEQTGHFCPRNNAHLN